MASIRTPLSELTTLAAADDLNGGTATLDLTGSAGALVIQRNDGTAGTVGVDVIEFSTDGGTTWADATAANIGQGHLGLLAEDGSKAAATNAALNAAGVEPSACAVFSLGPVSGPFEIRCSRGGTGASSNSAAWTTGAPSVVAFKIG
jgi:hypothetical protein